MFEMYIASVAIFMIVNYCMAFLFGDAIKKMGWVNENREKVGVGKKFVIAFCLSAIPIVRVGIIMIYVFMVANTKEEFEKWKAEKKK